MMDRQIVCLAVPSFELALARLIEPRLRNRPIGVAPVVQPRTVLQDVSSEAALDGLYPGMTLQQALQRCPALHILTPDAARTAQAHTMLSRIITRYAPVWEPIQSGAFLLDLTGTARLFGPACDTAARLQRDIALQARFDGVSGIGSNKLVAQTAAGLVQPAQLYEVRHGSERAFMAPLSIETLPVLHHPRMKPVRQCLNDLNLRTFDDVAATPLPALNIAVGKWATPLLRWAQGIDSTPVMPPPSQPRLEVSRALEPDDIDDVAIWHCLADLLEQLCHLLRTQQRVCGQLALTIQASDHVRSAVHHPIDPPSYWEIDLTPPLRALFRQGARRRIRIRTLTLSATELTVPAEQCELFEAIDAVPDHRTRAQQVTLALDRLRARFGAGIIRYGRTH
jgi:DNA polymerase-4